MDEIIFYFTYSNAIICQLGPTIKKCTKQSEIRGHPRTPVTNNIHESTTGPSLVFDWMSECIKDHWTIGRRISVRNVQISVRNVQCSRGVRGSVHVLMCMCSCNPAKPPNPRIPILQSDCLPCGRID